MSVTISARQIATASADELRRALDHILHEADRARARGRGSTGVALTRERRIAQIRARLAVLDRAEPERPGRGGRRPGAGRPARGHEARLDLHLTAEEAEALARVQRALGARDRSEAIRRLLLGVVASGWLDERERDVSRL